jgi:hypothetical protein
MTIPALKRSLGTAALALALAACKNDSTGSSGNGSGDLSFTYSGAVSGQFTASGEFDRNNTSRTEFGVAAVDEGNVVLAAADQVQANRTDLFIMSAPASVGTTTCTPGSSFQNCRIDGLFAVGFTSAGDLEPDAIYSGYVGTIQVTELTDDRVRGTFSLLLEDESGVNSVEARSGSFDLPIVPESQILGNRSPLTVASLNRVLSRR